MIELLILTRLFFGGCHGYEIKKMFPGLKINNNTIYPLLKKLVENGCVRMDVMEQDKKPAKKVYELTDKGRDRLLDLLAAFDRDKAAVPDEFYLRVAFFQFLPRETIEKILSVKEAYLDEVTERQNLMHILKFFPDKDYDILYMKNHISAGIHSERQLVQALKEKYGI